MLHQVTRHRAADQATQNQTEGGTGHRHFRGVFKAVAFDKQLAPGRPGTVTAGQGNRAGDQAHQRVQTQHFRHADADSVLHQQQAQHHKQEYH